MLGYNQYRFEEAQQPNGAAHSPEAYMRGLENYLIQNVERQFAALKTYLDAEFRKSASQNQGMMGKLKNWWGNWMNGTTGESVETLPIGLAAFADEQLLQELHQIMEGPIDQTIAQMTYHLDKLKTQIIATIRDGIRRVNQAQAKDQIQIKAQAQAKAQAAARRRIPDSKLGFSTTTGQVPGVSQFDTGSSYSTPKTPEPTASQPSEPEEPVVSPEKSFDPLDGTQGITPRISRKGRKVAPVDAETEPSPVDAKPEVPEPKSTTGKLDADGLSDFGDWDPFDDPWLKSAQTANGPEGREEPEVKKQPSEGPQKFQEPPAAEPPLRSRRRKVKLDDDLSDEEDQQKWDKRPQSAEDIIHDNKILRHWQPDVKAAYEAESDPVVRRKMIHFLQNIPDKETLERMREGDQMPKVLNWIKEFDPETWPKIAFNLNQASPVILSNQNKFKRWANWVLKEGIDKTTATIVERFRQRRLSR